MEHVSPNSEKLLSSRRSYAGTRAGSSLLVTRTISNVFSFAYNFIDCVFMHSQEVVQQR